MIDVMTHSSKLKEIAMESKEMKTKKERLITEYKDALRHKEIKDAVR